jgi:hypothetical protein
MMLEQPASITPVRSDARPWHFMIQRRKSRHASRTSHANGIVLSGKTLFSSWTTCATGRNPVIPDIFHKRR